MLTVVIHVEHYYTREISNGKHIIVVDLWVCMYAVLDFLPQDFVCC